ncbi:MAG TPA: protein translocase subunit SecD [Candidatus Acidoferrales bacterium]|nr:protein translocase subunit SecD [Candidatus Acidoferrales bacterium]
MHSNLKWKFAFILGVILICVFGLIGVPKSWTAVKQNLADNIKLGLDLQGGTHLIIQVQVQEAISGHTDQALDRLTRVLREEKNIRFEEIRKLDDTHILVRNVAVDQASAFRDIATDQFTEWDLSPAPGETAGYTLTLKPSTIAAIRTQTMQQSIETIRRRVDQLGLTEPTIAENGRGENEILVQLPGEDDPARVKNVIQAGGQLELKLVVGDKEYSSETEALAEKGGVLPPGTELLKGRNEARQTGQTAAQEVWYLVDRVPAVTGRDLRNAQPVPSTDNPGYYEVNFTLSTDAGKRFGIFTERNINRRMAIVLDHKVYSAPNIQSRIEDSGRITGRFGNEEAKDLALVLRSGSLPASIVYLEERTVSASLGADSIRQGVHASIVSLVAVMVFMAFYYRVSGWNAILALILNLIILLACLAYFGAVLTLPGIAGVILTIGMGVDSNVLVFERIREELRAGKAPSSAVEAGFDRAFLTIVDTHVTTVVSCIFLFMFGTGPVRGFAITLVIGLLSNLFTAIYVSRTIFAWHLARMSRQEELSI